MLFRAVVAIAAKDLRSELRSRRVITSVGLFALLAVLVFYFTLESRRDVLMAVVPSVLWVTVIFAGTLGISRTLSAERDSGSLDALLLAPIPRVALFYGKLISTWLYTLVVALVVALALSLLFNIGLFAPELWLVILLGTLGFATTGTLLGSMAIHADGRETTLPILVLPIALPIVIACVRATGDILAGLPASDWLVWLTPLISLDIIFLVLTYFLFDFVVEE